MFARPNPNTNIHFPVYLLPPSPFQRWKKSPEPTCSNDSAAPDSDKADSYLAGNTSHLRCAKCSVDICLVSQIISKGFTGRHGRAYLVSPIPINFGRARASCLPNTRTDPPSSRQLVTGAHTVSDVHCALCGSILGWRYDGAEEESQQYKVGKYILETKMICSSSDWMNGDIYSTSVSLHYNGVHPSEVRDIEFDSQDEDECEDLFAGVWNASLASKRRKGRSFKKTEKEGFRKH